MEEQDILTAEEAQRYLGVSRATFWNVARRAGLPRYTRPLDARRVFFRKADLDDLKRARPVEEKAT